MAPTARKLTKPTATAHHKPAQGKDAPRKPSVRPALGRSRKVDKSKMKGKRPRHKLKLKGWLATPADWARFNAWAKVNAQPKKTIELPPIVRPSRPLPQLKKRIRSLSVPRKGPEPGTLCRIDFTISRLALKAVASKRTILLSLPNLRLTDYGRVYYKVSPAALCYEATPRILELSQPKALVLPVECKPKPTSMCERRGVDEERLRKLALAKKLLACPQQLTPEEMAELFTPSGIRRSALKYKITPWMTYLSLPMYKRIKERKDPKAITWKKTLIEEGEQRGKEAMEEFERKAEARRMARKRKYDDSDDTASKAGGDAGEGEDEDEETEDENAEEKEERAKRRKIEKNAWRFAPSPEKADPHGVKKAAQSATASPRTEKLAAHRERKDRVTRPNAFSVRKGALSASPSGRIESLAKPPRPRSPVERKPPREKDKYGRPIFIIPVYEKVLPKTKPYKMRDCPEPEKKTKKTPEKRPIDPIVYEPTYDPVIYPQMAKRQKLERKRAEKLSSKKKPIRRLFQRKSKKTEVKDEPKIKEEPPDDTAEEDQPPIDESAEETAAEEEE